MKRGINKNNEKNTFLFKFQGKDKGSRREPYDVNITKILNSLSGNFSNRTADMNILIKILLPD